MGGKEMLKNKPVPMPEKRIVLKKVKNETEYVYYTLRAYRNKQGEPTSDEISIGKKDKDTGMLIPNRNYYDIFESTKPTKESNAIPNKVRSCGNSVALTEVTEQIGLMGILKE
jgi:hypothetical protein